MEVVLNKIGNQTDVKSVEGLFETLQAAKAMLQTPLAQCGAFEKRQKCLDCFSIALAAVGRPKFAALAFEGIQLILRDHATLASEKGTPEGQTRAEQLISTLTAIPIWRSTPATQCQALTVLVQLISTTEIPLRLKEVMNALEICKQTYATAADESTSVRPAARAALTQMLNSYAQNRLIGADGEEELTPNSSSRGGTEIGALMDVTALLGELVSRMGTAIEEAFAQQQNSNEAIQRASASNDQQNQKKATASGAAGQPLVLPLDALFSVLSALDAAHLERHLPLFSTLKNDLLPNIICHLVGSSRHPSAYPPATDDCSAAAGGISGASKRIGSLLRRATSIRQSTDAMPSAISPAGIALDGAESARSFYQVVEQLIRLFTPMALSSQSSSTTTNSTNSIQNDIFFLLEELWRSALLAPPIPKRVEAIRLIKRLCAMPTAFGELLQLTAASGTDSFWLLMVECLEECCCHGSADQQQQKLAMEALRTLNALFCAISQLISVDAFPKAEFPVKFFSQLAKMEEKPIKEEEENADPNANGKGGRRRSSVLRRQSYVEQPPEDPIGQMFMEAFVTEMPKWQKCQNPSELDGHLQQFAVEICQHLNAKLYPGQAGARADEEAAGESTPEDSEEEDAEEEKRKRTGKKEAQRLTEIEAYSLGIAAILEMDKSESRGNPIWNNKTMAFAQHQGGGGGGGEAINANGLGSNNNTNVSGLKIHGFPLMPSANPEYRRLLKSIMGQIHQNANNLPNCQNVSRQFNLFGSDPLMEDICKQENANDSMDQNGHHSTRLLVARWLCTRLSSCWGSIRPMLGQFSMAGGSGGKSPVNVVFILEEGKLLTTETLGSFVPLAIQLGMCPQLEWTFENIGEQVCTLEDLREAIRRWSSKRGGVVVGREDAKSARRFCGRVEIQAMQVVMENAVLALAIVPGIAKHVIRCIQFLWEWERWHFQLAKSTIDAIYEAPSLPIVPATKSGQNSPIGQLMGAIGEQLSSTEIARIMDQFMGLIDRLFTDSPTALPFNSLCALLSAIANANEDNLQYSGGLAPAETAAQLLQRVGQLICAMAHSPIAHKLAAWHSVKDHLVQCASSASVPPEICRRTLDILQEMLNALLHWEWGGPVPKDHQQRAATLQGWNAIQFGIFAEILDSPKMESNTAENCVQIGQILLAFIESNADLVGTGWSQLFYSIKMIAKRAFSPECNTETIGNSLIPVAIEVLEKFLKIEKPTVLIVAMPNFIDTLLAFIGFECTSAKEQNDDNATLMDQLLAILDQTVRVLLEHLFGTPIPMSALPRGFGQQCEQKLAQNWSGFWHNLEWKGRLREEEDYLRMLPDLRTECRTTMSTGNGGGSEGGGGGGEWPNFAHWLNEARGSMDEYGALEPPKCPWHHLKVDTDRIVALEMMELLGRQMDTILLNEGGQIGDAGKRARLALCAVELVKRIGQEIGPNFAAFCLCHCVLAKFRQSIGTPQTRQSARALKQFLGIVCSHPAVADLLHSNQPDQETDEWRICLLGRLLDLAVKCVAKGGTLSLAGCAILQHVCAIASSSQLANNQMAPICARHIWLASRYALFPVRMLIAQFFVNSLDFSGDLGQMKVSYRLGLNPTEVEERVDSAQQLANQVFRLDDLQMAQNGTNEEEEDEENANSNGGAHFPAKFAYLFLFDSADTKKLSMGLDELMDSLVCQQLLVQLTEQQLLANGPNGNVGPLLAVLNATLVICEQFQQRPGLKSLLQKLTGLPSSANLWKLCLSACHAFVRFEMDGMRREKDDRNRNVIGNAKRIGHLLEWIGGQESAKKNPSAASSPVGGGAIEKSSQNAASSNNPPPSIRANPFLGGGQRQPSQQQQQEGQKADKLRMLVLGKFIQMLEEEIAKLNAENATEFRSKLAEEIGTMIGDWSAEEGGGRKPRELLEQFAEKLAQK